MEATYVNPHEGSFARNSAYIDLWINEAKILNLISRQGQVAHLLWDAAANQFVFFSDKHGVLGTDDNIYFTRPDGVKYFLSKIHPGFIRAVYLMYQKCLAHCKNQTGNVKDNLFQFDALYQKNQTENIQLLVQALVVETDQSGIPILFLIAIQDITYLKKENTANLVISSCQQTTIWNYCFDNRVLEQIKCFSSQEKRVLQYLGQKKGSKEIANLLNTSSHTIDTQRRSLLHKTNCVDCTALITYARMTGILS